MEMKALAPRCGVEIGGVALKDCSAADMAANIVRRYIGPSAERNALEVLQIDKARTHLDIQPRRPLSTDYDDTRLRAVILMMEQNIEDMLPISHMGKSSGSKSGCCWRRSRACCWWMNPPQA